MKKVLFASVLCCLSLFSSSKTLSYPAHLYTPEEAINAQIGIDEMTYYGGDTPIPPIFIGCYSNTEWVFYAQFRWQNIYIDEDNSFRVLAWSPSVMRAFSGYVWTSYGSITYYSSDSDSAILNGSSYPLSIGIGTFSSDPAVCPRVGLSCSSGNLDNPNDMLCEHNYHGGNMTINGKRREY